MAQATLTIGNQTIDFVIPDDAVDGLRFASQLFNAQNNTNLTPLQYASQLIQQATGAAASRVREELKKRLLQGFETASPQTKVQVLQALGVSKP